MNPNNNCFNYCLMPSEIARLVYGYCLETGCTKSAQYLLEESPYLKEFAQGIKNGYPFSTKINNQSLLQVLNGQWHGPMFGSDNNFNSNNVSMQAEYHDLKDDKITSDQYSTPKHKILYSMNSGNNYSPRRKNATPKRLKNNTFINHQQHYNQQQQQQRSHQLQPESQQSKQYGILSQHSCDNSPIFSSPLSSNESEAQIEVQPKIIFDELLKCGPLHDKVANTIQKLIHANQDDNPNQLNSIIDDNDNEISEKSDLNTANDENNVANKHSTIEKDSIPSLEEILDSLTEEPVFHDFVDMVVEKEIANTPFKGFQTPNSCSSAGSNNLNTPCVTLPSDDTKNYDPKQMPVKNIMKEMEEQQQQNNQPADDTMMNCEYLRKISPTNQSNDIKSSRQKENLKISNSQQRIVNSSQNFIRSLPILSISGGRSQNTKYTPKYRRLSYSQQKVQQAFNIAPMINVNNVSNNTATQTEPNKTLTTTIEVVPGDNKTKTSESELGSNVENVISQQQINTGIDVLSAPVSWPSNTITTQPIILPSNQLAWDNNNGLLYLSYPSDDTIYYIDPQQISTSTIATINDDFVNTTPSTSQNIQIRTNQQEESVASSPATETFSSQQDVDDNVKIIEKNFESKQQQSPKISRPSPSILSKKKQKNSSNIFSEALKSLADDDNLVKDNLQIDNNSSQTKKCDDNHKLRRKLESSQISRSENPKKRKIDHEEMRKRRNSLDMSDDKIKTILRSDLEKFLVDIHKDENEK